VNKVLYRHVQIHRTRKVYYGHCAAVAYFFIAQSRAASPQLMHYVKKDEEDYREAVVKRF